VWNYFHTFLLDQGGIPVFEPGLGIGTIGCMVAQRTGVLELHQSPGAKPVGMKKRELMISAFCLFLTGQAIAQTASQEATDSVAHAAQGPGVVGQGILPAPPSQNTPYFNAYFDGNDDRASRRVSINWQLQSEFNADHFVLERSTELNPTHFDPLHEVVARGDGAGEVYNDRDDAPEGTVSYYRLKVVLKDGNAFYSPVVSVNMSNRISMALKPSVLTMGGTLHFNENTDPRKPVTVNFFDGQGRLTASYLVNSSYFDINTSGWSRGIYIYRISDGIHPFIEAGKIMIM
jgi:hypothetical protein